MAGNQDVNYSLICAVREGRLERARELINSFGLSYSQAWSEGYVLLCEAFKNKHTAVAKLLLTSGSKVNSKKKKLTNTPLHFAVINGDIEIVKMILDKDANINAKNQDGKTPLHIAIENKKMEVTELLLKHKANVNARDNYGTSPLHVAVEIGCLQIVEHLLKYEVHINYVCTLRWRKGYAPLHFAVEKGSKEVITLLLSRGANIDVKGEDSITPLHIAAKKGYIRIAEDLLNHGACTHSLTLKEGYMPLHFASELGSEEAVKLFLNRGADINASTKDNLTPLHIATKTGHKTVVKLLLQHGAKVDNQDKDGKTILHLAVEKGYLMIVEDVLKYCPDINNQSNRSSLKTAVYGYGKKYKKIVEALLEYGFIVNTEDANNPKLLHATVEKGYLKIVKDLLKYGADVNTFYNSTSEGFTPLHSAATNKQTKGANAKQKDGTTALHIATQKGHKEVVRILLECGAKVDSKIKSGITPLHLGSQKGYQEIIETILKFGADINSRDVYGRTALHIASQEGHVEAVATLLEYGSDINITSRNNQTPLDFAIVGIRSFYSELNSSVSDDDYYDSDHGVCSCEETAVALKYHIVKMKAANLYVSEENLYVSEENLLLLMSSYKISDFHPEIYPINKLPFYKLHPENHLLSQCEEEITRMKSEKINNSNISFYDILAKSTNSLTIYMRNENIVQVLKSDDYKTKFPIYANMMESNFRKGMIRKELLEQGNKIFHFLFNNFPEIPHDCTEKIFSYLSDKDLRILMNACKPPSISNPNTNINNVVITSNIS